jgi:immune inhibitor A
MSRPLSSRRWRLVAAAPAVGLIVAGAVTGGGAATSAAAAPMVTDLPDSQQTYINYVAPKFDRTTGHGKNTLGKARAGRKDALTLAKEVDRKYAGGNPKAARQLAKLEQQAIKGKTSPRQLKHARGTQTAELLTILVEFNPTANDDFSNVMVPKTVFGDRTCVAGTTQNGPLHNNIANPADAPFPDNNTFWVPDFSPAHYNQMLYPSQGITDPVRPDLNGGKGIDISGLTMRNHYLEMSKGAYTVSGSATPWVKVAHSEAWYGSDRCTKDEHGDWVAGPPQRQVGHPSNPAGPGQLAIDAVTALMEQNPDFPLADYDVEDQFDRDGDGNVFEKDGYIDHVVLVHAGEDKSGGGGDQGVYAIWAHSSNVVNGAPIGNTGVRLDNYIVQPEDSGVGVFSHEYGHDLGLPDLYDTSGAGDSDIEFWDLMSSGSHSGQVFQTMPTHMGIWDKWILGWAEPEVMAPGAKSRTVLLGQAAKTPVGTKDGVQILLPQKKISLAVPHSGANMWWSNNDQDWADVRLTRDVPVPAGATDARFWMWNDFTIEKDWDFGFVEISTDGGTTWNEQVVRNEAGAVVTTPADYGDPNGRMHDYGGKKFGLTGTTGGWRHDYVDLTPYAGSTIKLRLRYATDEAFVERGWFADDFSVTNGGATVWSDDAEANNGWTNEVTSFTTTTGAGWKLDGGTSFRNQYYMVEWRNLDGFDRGLQYGYDSTYTPDNAGGAWKVSKVSYNAPGMLVWYRDTTYANDNHVTASTFDLPSTGSKGGLLLVDSHFDPLRHTGAAAAKYDEDTDENENFPVRMETADVAFTTWGTSTIKDCFTVASPTDEYCTAYGNQGGVRKFTDAKGWYPGIEFDGKNIYLRDTDASVVVPSRDNQQYTTRVVHPDGSPAEEVYGAKLLNGLIVLGTGNPGDEGKDYGVSVELVKAKDDNRVAQVVVTPATP